MTAQAEFSASAHIPVLLSPILDAIRPVTGPWLDGTFGAGGYTRALLAEGASVVYAIDRDPEVFERAKPWASDFGNRLRLIEGEFANLDQLAADQNAGPLSGVVLDIGVSSMQIDQAERGFSFMQDGPLDMRMAQSGPSAADIVNTGSVAEIADILFQYGEERASRRIAGAIEQARKAAPIDSTGKLVEVIASVLPKQKPGQAHPATRSFQALRIAVNDELGQLAKGLYAAEAALGNGGILAVVTFHSLEDRIVKRFFQARSGGAPKGNRWEPEVKTDAPRFEMLSRKAITADPDELQQNPRSRSAKLRLARRTSAPQGELQWSGLGLPKISFEQVSS